MLNTKLANKLLTKAEQQHLTKDANIHTLAAMQRQVNFMENDTYPFCFTCRHIARKLNMKPEEAP